MYILYIYNPVEPKILTVLFCSRSDFKFVLKSKTIISWFYATLRISVLTVLSLDLFFKLNKCERYIDCIFSIAIQLTICAYYDF